MTKLYIMDGAMAGKSFDLKSGTTLIGRTADNDLQIKDAAVSRKHLKIMRKEERFFVEDLGSQNGTWVRGQLIRPKEAVEVEEGVSIIIGDVLANLGRKPSEDYLATQYSIDLSDLVGDGGENLLYKSTLTTNRRRLEKIHEVSIVLSQSLDIDEICEKIMDSLFYCLKEINSGIVLLIDSDTGKLEERISRSRDNKNDIKLSYSRTIVDRVIREGKALMMADTRQEDQEDLSDSIEMMRLRSIMCAPLISKSGIRGVIYVHSTSTLSGFPKDDLFLLAGLSTPAAVAVEKALLYSERKQAEEALQKAHEELEKRVEERTAELLKANRKLETEIKDRKLTEKNLKNTLRELQETKDMLIQSEKLAAIGRLTTGIAHEILNPVNIISMRLQMLKESEGVPDGVRNALNIIKNQLDRISEISRNLGQFSRVSEKHITMNNLNKIIEEILNLYAPQFKVEDIDTDIQYHPDLLLIPLDKDKVQQVILNIISNAVAAMSGQKTRLLRITTKPTLSKDSVQVIISDTGTGIDDSHIDKVFDPFFTTKDPGKGVGLGLYISYGIVKDYGGKIWAENNEWGGASFIIEFPVGKYVSS